MERFRITEEACAYFVTYTVIDWLPIFTSESPVRILIDSLNFCIHEKYLCVNAYVVMPSHMHAIVFDAEFDAARLATSLDAFRKFTGRQLCDWCDESGPSAFAKNLRECVPNDRSRRFWQPSRHLEAITSESFWRSKFDYLHDNPRRAGFVRLPQDWRWSSANFWMSDGETQSDVALAAIEW